MQFTTNLHLVLRLRMGGASPTFLLCDFMAWAGSTLYLYHFNDPTETAAIQIIYRKCGNSTACVLTYLQQCEIAII